MTDTSITTQQTAVLDPQQVADMLQISLRHLGKVRDQDPTFPSPRMVGTLPRWTYASIHAWVQQPYTDQLVELVELDEPHNSPTDAPTVACPPKAKIKPKAKAIRETTAQKGARRGIA